MHVNGERKEQFEALRRALMERRGDRVLAERLLRAVLNHLEQNHPYRSLAEIRRIAPADYDLYLAASE